jgi:DNA-binding transcriptional LysR family regulator
MVEYHAVLHDRQQNSVIQSSEHSVHGSEHLRIRQLLDSWNWDDLQLVCQIARSSSLRKATNLTGLSINTIRSRLRRLELSLGTIIFERSHDGIILTSDGAKVLQFALEMQTLRSSHSLKRGNDIVVKPGEVSICCSEGIGEFWLMSHLLELDSQLPNHIISFRSEFDQTKIHSGDHDIRIGFLLPEKSNFICKKLSSIHCILYASPEYIAKRGNPQSLDDLDGHAYVAQVGPGLEADAIKLFVGSMTADKLVTLRVNTSVSLYHAVANGFAVAALPTFASAMSRHVVPLSLPVRLKFDLWLSFNPAARDSVPVRTTIDWLQKCFDPKIYPWFSDRFVHPDEFGATLNHLNRVDELDHMISALNQSGMPKTEPSI